MKKIVKLKSFLAIDRLLVPALLAFFLFQLSSCEETLQASFDTSNQPEGGPSAYKTGDVVAFNVATEWMIGLNGVGPGKLSSPGRVPLYATENPLENPFDQPFVASTGGSGSIRINPGVEFVQKGSKTQGVTSRLNYLEGAADVVYFYNLPGGGAVYGGLGPYLAYGIGGKTGNGTESVSSFGGDDGYKRFDAGLNLKAAYRLPNSLQFGLGYDFGLYNQSPESDFTSKNRSFSINVGYSIEKIIGAFKRK